VFDLYGLLKLKISPLKKVTHHLFITFLLPFGHPFEFLLNHHVTPVFRNPLPLLPFSEPPTDSESPSAYDACTRVTSRSISTLRTRLQNRAFAEISAKQRYSHTDMTKPARAGSVEKWVCVPKVYQLAGKARGSGLCCPIHHGGHGKAAGLGQGISVSHRHQEVGQERARSVPAPRGRFHCWCGDCAAGTSRSRGASQSAPGLAFYRQIGAARKTLQMEDCWRWPSGDASIVVPTRDCALPRRDGPPGERRRFMLNETLKRRYVRGRSAGPPLMRTYAFVTSMLAPVSPTSATSAVGSVPLFLAGAFLAHDTGKARDCGLYLRPIVGATEKRRAWARGSRSVIGIKRSGRRGRVVYQPQGGV